MMLTRSKTAPKKCKCESCGLEFQDLEAHRRMAHEDEDEVRCCFCGLLQPDGETLVGHLIEKHGVDPEAGRACYICGKPSKDVMHLWNHLESHPETHIFACSNCPTKTTTKLALLQHPCFHNCSTLETCGEVKTDKYINRRNKRSLKPVGQSDTTCPTCKITFLTRRSYMDHRLILHSILMCPVCDKVLRNRKTLSHHLGLEHGPGVYWTNIHQKGESGSWKVRKMRVVVGEWNMKCPHCDLSFAKDWKRKEHLRKFHRGPYKCNICNKELSSMTVLKQHMLTHEAEFQCADCHTIFGRKERIMNHLSGNKCPKCKVFIFCRTLFDEHMNTQHVFTCNVCSEKQFNTYRIYKWHMSMYHIKKNSYKCDKCEHSSHTEVNLKRHKRRMHSITLSKARNKKK